MKPIRRVAFLLTFIAIMPPFVIVAPVTLIAAGISWLIRGGDQDRILLNPVFVILTDLPFKVLGSQVR